MCRAVLFDLDDTLFDRDAAFRRWAAGFASHRPARFPVARRADDLDLMMQLDDRGRRPRLAFASDLVRGFRLDEGAEAIAAAFPAALMDRVEADLGVAEAVTALTARARVAVVTGRAARPGPA